MTPMEKSCCTAAAANQSKFNTVTVVYCGHEADSAVLEKRTFDSLPGAAVAVGPHDVQVCLARPAPRPAMRKVVSAHCGRAWTSLSSPHCSELLFGSPDATANAWDLAVRKTSRLEARHPLIPLGSGHNKGS